MQIGFGVSALCKGLNGGGLDGIGNYTRELLYRMHAPSATEPNWDHIPKDAGVNLVPFAFGCAIPPELAGVPGVSLGRYSINAAWSVATGANCMGIRSLAQQVDLIHATDHYIPKCSTVPVVATLMDAIPLSHPHWLRSEFRSLKNALWIRAAQWADAVITISEYSKSELTRWAGIPSDRITVIPLGVSNRWYQQVPEAELARVKSAYALPDRFFVSLGTLQPRKNVGGTISAHRALDAATRAKAPLLIIGRAGWKCEDVVASIDSETSSGTVRWLQHVPDADLLPILKSATGLVFPSLAEGFGLPVLEAFAAGVPVITSNTTSLPEVAGDAAISIDPNDTAAMRDAMRELLEDPDRANQLRVRGLDRARQFTWDDCVARTVDVYRNAAND
jgi:alpha-1,3-rhamnosyl/mannosyltransferase